jgi:hypothetical protein
MDGWLGRAGCMTEIWTRRRGEWVDLLLGGGGQELVFLVGTFVGWVRWILCDGDLVMVWGCGGMCFEAGIGWIGVEFSILCYSDAYCLDLSYVL